MAKVPRKKKTTSYRSVGETYDGVRVIAPKTKSKTFTEAQVRKAIKKALEEVGAVTDPEPKPKPLRDTDALRVEQRSDGKFSVKRKGAKRASAVEETQKDAIAKAKELEPEKAPIAKRVRRSPAGKRGTWRET